MNPPYPIEPLALASGLAGCLERRAAAFLGGIELQLHLLDIEQLLLELLTAFVDQFEHAVQLLPVAGPGIVELDERLAFGQGKAQPLAAQDQLQRDAILGSVDALLASARWRQHALFFVETNSAGGDVQLAGQVGDAVGLFCHGVSIILSPATGLSRLLAQGYRLAAA